MADSNDRIRINEEIYKRNAPYNGVKSELANSYMSNISSFEEQFDMPAEYFLRLFTQSIIIHTLLNHDFPHSVKSWIRKLFDQQIRVFCQSPLTPANTANTISILIEQIILQLDSVLDQVEKLNRQGDLSNEEVAEIRHKSEMVVKNLKCYLSQVEIISKLQNEDKPSDEMVRVCIDYVDKAHDEGRSWARELFGFAELFKADLYLKNLPIRYGKADNGSTQIETRVNHLGIRYLQFTFSPTDFLISQFILLPFRFFHEYLSHLTSGLYDPKDKAAILNNLSSKKYHPIELTEGWLLHTARTFFDDNAKTLLKKNDHQHLADDIIREIDKMTMPNRDNDSTFFIEQVQFGYDMASRFLRLLESTVFPGNPSRAKQVYYHFSVDLITYYLEKTGGFSQKEFINKLSYWIRQYPDKLEEFLLDSLETISDEQNEFINLFKLWANINTVDLKITLG